MITTILISIWIIGFILIYLTSKVLNKIQGEKTDWIRCVFWPIVFIYRLFK